MRKLFTSVALLGALTGLSAQAQPASDIIATLKVTQWSAENVISATSAAIERFKEKYPNVTIETQYIPVVAGNWGDYNNAIINQIASGNSPDIIGAAIEGFAQLASSGVLVDLDSIAAEDAAAKEVLEGIEANLLNGMRTKGTGQLNFFPTEWNNIVMYYNKDAFDAAGADYPASDWTWDDFVVTAKELTVRDDSGNVTQYGYFVPGFNFGQQPWYFTNSAAILDDDWREPTVDTPQFRESLQYLHDLIHTHKVAPAYESGVGTEKFTAGQVAMFSAGHWPVPSIKEAGMENVGVQHMPKNTVQTTVFGIGGLSITKEAENRDLAWAFVAEMTGKEYQKSLADGGASIPSAREFATTEEYVAWPDNSEIFYETAATAIPVTSPSNFATVQEITGRHLSTYLNDEVSLDDTIAGLDRELQRAMSRVK
ncbi:sugar ABC transporter substrate-binding protein [Pararhizobium sp. IMCC21322]|uniref:ABC transporter substrate-binding protein n=1 Tax=Pararhizobium sp. IMCC21322 TaxID=3067903 RepID=UPI002741F6F8|nr:sugar ABC transporter substrate-binding protein [Pararhizobium sp. IMCC21322]